VQSGSVSTNSFASNAKSQQDRMARGRELVIDHGCGDCHSSGVPSPMAQGWLAGVTDTAGEFQIGPFRTRPKNLTPDNTTGIGRFSERQIFNALRFGLRPEETPDVEITSTTPGQGNFPAHPHYLAPPMPWIAFRHMKDDELRAIAAYIKNGLKPVKNQVKDSDGPRDFWARTYAADKIGPYPAPAYPTLNERAP
jgi:mono/diheme cytochrome c family protein